jgi:hypothetical protein
MAYASRMFDWHDALVVVRPATLIRWQRLGFRLLWGSSRGRAGRDCRPRRGA